jgi:hypothetical protein
MNSTRLSADSFLTGAVAALLAMPLVYLGMNTLGDWLADVTGYGRWALPPQPQLFTLLIFIFVFRLLVVNYKREQAGKGWLFVTFLTSMAYAFWFFRLRHAS